MTVRLEANTVDSDRKRVDVFVGKAWGTLCSTSFSLQEAHVVCTQAGFTTAIGESDVSAVSTG